MARAIKIEGITSKPLSRREFLPDITQLKSEQINVLRTPLSENIIVSGPAGSGKTILAVYRYNGYIKSNFKGELLVYGNILKNYMKEKIALSSVEIPINGIFEYVKDQSGISVDFTLPDSEKFSGSAQKSAEWAKKNKMNLDFIIIDEAQDFFDGHLDFCGYYAKVLTLFADDAQRLYKHGNCTTNIIGKYWVDHNKKLRRFDIKGNYRNQPSVANLAKPFYDKRSKEPFSSADLEGANEKVYIFVSSSLNSLKDYLVKAAKYYIDKLVNETPKIAILVQDSETMKIAKASFVKQKYKCVEVENASNVFNIQHPIILTMHSAKGLEFDYILLFNLDFQKLKNGHPNNYNQIVFTAITRARKSLSIFILDNQIEFIEKIKNEVSDDYYQIYNI